MARATMRGSLGLEHDHGDAWLIRWRANVTGGALANEFGGQDIGGLLKSNNNGRKRHKKEKSKLDAMLFGEWVKPQDLGGLGMEEGGVVWRRWVLQGRGRNRAVETLRMRRQDPAHLQANGKQEVRGVPGHWVGVMENQWPQDIRSERRKAYSIDCLRHWEFYYTETPEFQRAHRNSLRSRLTREWESKSRDIT